MVARSGGAWEAWTRDGVGVLVAVTTIVARIEEGFVGLCGMLLSCWFGYGGFVVQVGWGVRPGVAGWLGWVVCDLVAGGEGRVGLGGKSSQARAKHKA